MIEKCDSTYVNELMQMLYADDLSVLLNRSVSGRQNKRKKNPQSDVNNTIKTQPVTPKKLQIILDLFETRIQSADISMENKVRRLDRVKTLVKDAIQNIRKMIGSKTITTEFVETVNDESLGDIEYLDEEFDTNIV